jgi:hypothetical protein
MKLTKNISQILDRSAAVANSGRRPNASAGVRRMPTDTDGCRRLPADNVKKSRRKCTGLLRSYVLRRLPADACGRRRTPTDDGRGGQAHDDAMFFDSTADDKKFSTS